jgi:sRNA-binding carbon storage regulator CsrA
MRKISRYERKNTDDVLVVKNGITYRVLDLGGSKIEIRVKSPKELKKDKKAFKKYLSGPDGDIVLP